MWKGPHVSLESSVPAHRRDLPCTILFTAKECNRVRLSEAATEQVRIACWRYSVSDTFGVKCAGPGDRGVPRLIRAYLTFKSYESTRS
jgi:hypothetical protein